MEKHLLEWPQGLDVIFRKSHITFVVIVPLRQQHEPPSLLEGLIVLKSNVDVIGPSWAWVVLKGLQRSSIRERDL
jgi:hypothetical protein